MSQKVSVHSFLSAPMQLTADEFYDALRLVLPELTREEFELRWAEFQRYKAEVQTKRKVN